MTEQEFRLAFSEDVAESDATFCEMVDAENGPYPELSNDGLTRLTNIAAAVAEPLFEELEQVHAANVSLRQDLDAAVQREDNCRRLYHTADLAALERLQIIAHWQERAEKADAQVETLRAALDKAIGAYHVIRSMAHDYAKAGGEGPELRDWNEGERLILEASKAPRAPEAGKGVAK